MPRLSIIIPVYNEEQNLGDLYARLDAAVAALDAGTELIFVDDGSRDGTAAGIRKIAGSDPRVKFISFTRNFGHQVAIQAGLEHAKGDLVVIMDGDLQDPPELIPQLVRRQEETGAEVVLAKRRKRKNEPLLKRLSAAVFYRILNRLSSIDIPMDTGDFRLITSRVVRDLVNMREPNKFLRGQVAWLGYEQAIVEFDRDGRGTGSSHYTYGKMMRLALDAITGFSNFPLKFATVSGISISLVSFLLIIYVFLSKYVFHVAVSGWASIMVAVLFIGGIQLLSVGIIGEYISRINDAVRDRPMYVIRMTNMEDRDDQAEQGS